MFFSFGKKKKSLRKKAIKLPSNALNKKIIRGYNKGYSVSAKINKKIYTGKIMHSKYKKFKFAVKLNGKRYNFSSSQNKMIKLYLQPKRLVKKRKRSSFGKKKIVLRLRKTLGGSKYVSTGRKSPESSATLHKVGTTLKGLDGNMWTIKKASNGVKRWVKKVERRAGFGESTNCNYTNATDCSKNSCIWDTNKCYPRCDSLNKGKIQDKASSSGKCK